jgi:hypothetical protein
MSRISNEQLYELFVDTAKRCSSGIALLSDEQIEYNLFEEFDIGVRSFFHDDTLNKLVEAGMIRKEAVPICQEIRSRWIELDESNWTIDEIKGHPDWRRFFSSCDSLLVLLDQHD